MTYLPTLELRLLVKGSERSTLKSYYMNSKLLSYFHGDEMAAKVWSEKYALSTDITPDDMHKRIAKEFARIEQSYPSPELSEEDIYNLLKDFKYIIPGGSGLAGIGNTEHIGSLSNCFVIGDNKDSYEAIMRSREEQIQLMKRRGGVGKDISHLRPRGSKVNNVAKTSSGATSFMEVDSACTKEVAQDGRRGALMITMDGNHPDILEFILSKQDLSKITGANISVKVSDEFMEAVKYGNTEYYLKFPTTSTYDQEQLKKLYDEYYKEGVELIQPNTSTHFYIKKVNPQEIWNKMMQAAHASAEPGILFWNTILENSLDGNYPEFRPISTNPCFHPDSLVETVEGRIRIADITKPTYVYSMDANNKLCVVKSSAAFLTKKNAKTLKITLRTGESITVTPDHKMYVHNKGFIEARNLVLGDRIAHILRSRRGRRYAGVKLTTEGNREYVMEHRLVYEAVHGNIINMDIHHLDGDTFNNNINNLSSISHSEHSYVTATTQNPQTHQCRDEQGKFIPNGNPPAWKNTSSLPEHLATKFKNRFENAIVAIEEGEQTDVYDIQVPGTNCLIVNNMVAHNCGEIPLSPYDACRLLHINLSNCVSAPYTSEASFNMTKFMALCAKAMRLADNFIDLEIEAIDTIIANVEEKTKEHELWIKVRKTAQQGRRCGIGTTGWADMFAQLGIKYGSEVAVMLMDEISTNKFKAEYEESKKLGKERGVFPAFNPDYENRGHISLITGTSPGSVDSARRNISFSTVAPTGTISLLAQCSSGIEPVFSLYYTRRKRASSDDIPTYIDPNGEPFVEFNVIHPGVIKEYAVKRQLSIAEAYAQLSSMATKELDEIVKESVYYGNTAPEIRPIDRIISQSAVQSGTTHSISSTINLPESTTVEEISTIYMKAWEHNLKGVTVYREGSRSGILVTKEDKPADFKESLPPKRPKELQANLHLVSIKKVPYALVVGLYAGRPYETFAFKLGEDPIAEGPGKVIKLKKGHYKFIGESGLVIPNLQLANELNEERMSSILTSMLLRHGAPVKEIIKTNEKINPLVTSFTSAICRILSKYEKETHATCPECGEKLHSEGGCKICKSCGTSLCATLLLQ